MSEKISVEQMNESSYSENEFFLINEKKYEEIKKSVELLFTSKGLSSIIRFSTRAKVINQSVADHSFFTTIISYLIAKMEEKYNCTKIDYEKLMGFATFHDFPESLSGDIVRDFKKRSQEFETLYDKICDITVADITKDNPHSETIMRNCSGMGTDCIEGQIVKYSDIIDPFIYCINEMNLGNKTMEDVYNNCIKILDNSSIGSVKVMGRIIKGYRK